MPVSTEDPAVQLRRLRVELRSLRNQARRTQRDAAEAMDWSPSKLIRIESGAVRITPVDLRALLDYYDVKDADEVDRLVQLARSSRQDPWSEFREVHTQPWLRFLAYESSASRIRGYQCLLVPGLLQIEEYAFALYKTGKIDAEVAERRWEARLRRQELHERDEPPDMHFILDEAAVRRQVGGPRVMRRQLERLKDFSTRSHVTVQIIPFSAGSYYRLGGSFVVLEFPDANDEDVLHLEDPEGGQTLRDDTETTSAAVDRFLGLEDIALSPTETREMLDELTRDAPTEAGVKGPKQKE